MLSSGPSCVLTAQVNNVPFSGPGVLTTQVNNVPFSGPSGVLTTQVNNVPFSGPSGVLTTQVNNVPFSTWFFSCAHYSGKQCAILYMVLQVCSGRYWPYVGSSGVLWSLRWSFWMFYWLQLLSYHGVDGHNSTHSDAIFPVTPYITCGSCHMD